MMRLGIRDPELKRRLRRFRRQRRAHYSLILLASLFCLSLGAEWICNDVPFVMRYQGSFYFPMFKFYPATLFGDGVRAEPDYKAIDDDPKFKESGGWMVFPLFRFNANESMRDLGMPPPSPPTRKNWLGTDDRGRDLLTRLIYGFRNSMVFALVSWLFIVLIAYTVGSTQGFLGGRIDFVGQRITEIWHSLPVLYVIIFLLSIFPSGLTLLTVTWVAFSWISLASYIRAEVLRVRKQDFVTAGVALGADTTRLLFRHILPNSLTPVITFSPFIISASVGSLAALDYLGLGLPPPTASWGELLRQGKENLSSWWLAFFPFLSLFTTLLMLNFIGEGVRSAFDSRDSA